MALKNYQYGLANRDLLAMADTPGLGQMAKVRSFTAD